MDVNEYREVMLEDIGLAAEANSTNHETEFLSNVTNILTDAEEFDDFVESYYESAGSRNRTIQIDGYAIEETDGSCCIMISEYRGIHADDSMTKDVIERLFKRIRYFVEEAVENRMYTKMEESTMAFEFAKYLYENIDEITKFRFYILTDAFNKQKLKNIKDTEVSGKTVELNVWDITRIFDIVSSKTKKESIDIVFSDMEYEGIPCVKAVQYNNVKADIDIIKSNEIDEDNEVSNLISYTSYLAVVPGEILNKVYLDYGARLLEGNVRSFLSMRGKVNKSIQSTIKNYPEMFFAYNNGIAATATELDSKMTENGLIITRIKDLQIVNGGQTTASIASTLLSAKKDDSINIRNLFVPMKISVLEHEMSEKIIPKISEYSNSQNKVDASDFFSNHPFHIRMEEYSRKTPAPAINGNQYQQFWFYERTRGQYSQGKMKFKPHSSQIKQYETRYPSEQVIKAVELAKYMGIYEGDPHTVSKGGQAIVKQFKEKVIPQWKKSDSEFNAYYFKRIVALAIAFKRTDDIIKNTDWYKEKRSYKANIIAYAMSIIFDYVRKNNKGYSVDFIKIWNFQCVYPELDEQLKVLCTEVYHYITGPRETENVTEWCKKELCWERAQKESWTIRDSFLNSLVSTSSINEEIKEAKSNRKVENELDDIKLILRAGKDYWGQVMDWGKERRLLSDMELSLLKMAMNIEITGKVPSDKQSKVIINARSRMVLEGMPLQF